MTVPKVTIVLGFSAIILVTGLSLVGCKNSGIKLGKDIPADASVTKLADILAQPAAFNGKTVVMKGIISGQCASLCEFFFKEGAQQVTIFPQGYKFPRLGTGKKVTVYAAITSGPENTAFSALGIRTE